MRGELVHFTVLDVGAELDLARITTILGEAAGSAPLVSRSPAPTFAVLPAPLQVRLPGQVMEPSGVEVQVRVHRVGAVAVRIRVPFEVQDLDALPDFAAAVRLDGATLHDAGIALAQKVQTGLRNAFVQPYAVHVEPESYLVHCLTGDAPAPAELLDTHRTAVAALLAGERPGIRLAADTQETMLRHTLQYAEDDLVAAGWDVALVVGGPGTYEDTLDVIEVANLELLELRTYDAYLDKRLDLSFEAMDRLWQRGGIFRSVRGLLADTTRVSAELARLTDTLHDTGKSFGDWYQAKVHQRLRDRFHMADWEAAVQAKQDTMADVLHIAQEEANYRRGLVLEVTVVLLILLEGLFFVWEALWK